MGRVSDAARRINDWPAGGQGTVSTDGYAIAPAAGREVAELPDSSTRVKLRMWMTTEVHTYLEQY